MNIIPSGQHRTSTWSGGTTTELAIYPPSASYAARDFAWRLSTATVTVAESAFTSLPGFHRLLMVLEGEMYLEHEGYHQVTLLPFEQDSFSGSWLTHCAGTGRDFNLMLAEGWRGRLQAISLAGQDSIPASELMPDAVEALYCLSGQVLINLLLDGRELLLGEGDLLLVKAGQLASQKILITADSYTELIRASIWRE